VGVRFATVTVARAWTPVRSGDATGASAATSSLSVVTTQVGIGQTGPVQTGTFDAVPDSQHGMTQAASAEQTGATSTTTSSITAAAPTKARALRPSAEVKSIMRIINYCKGAIPTGAGSHTGT